MPNPKRRHSKTRTAKRRTHDALHPVPVGACPQCREAKAPRQESVASAAGRRADTMLMLHISPQRGTVTRPQRVVGGLGHLGKCGENFLLGEIDVF